jgi:hypothetical protein
LSEVIVQRASTVPYQPPDRCRSNLCHWGPFRCTPPVLGFDFPSLLSPSLPIHPHPPMHPPFPDGWDHVIRTVNLQDPPTQALASVFPCSHDGTVTVRGPVGGGRPCRSLNDYVTTPVEKFFFFGASASLDPTSSDGDGMGMGS